MIVFTAPNRIDKVIAAHERFGFKGYVMSDWGATHSLAVDKGMDQEMGFDSHNRFYNAKHLKQFPDEVDQSNIRMFT